MSRLQLLSNGVTNAKLAKSGVRSYILYMAPATMNSRGVNLCPASTGGCRSGCLFTAGRGAFHNVYAARLRKANWFVDDQRGFLNQLIDELDWINSKAKKLGQIHLVRLNGTTDIAWESLLKLDRWTSLRFYDYTKLPMRMHAYLRDPSWPSNYSLTFSQSEVNHRIAERIVGDGGTVAVVFSGSELPATYRGHPVVDGDLTDERVNDPRGVYIGLRAKGKAKCDTTGFVVTATVTDRSEAA